MDYRDNNNNRVGLEKDNLEKGNNEENLKSEYRILEFNEDRPWYGQEENFKKFKKRMLIVIGLLLFAVCSWLIYVSLNTGFTLTSRNNFTRYRNLINNNEIGFFVSESESYRYLFTSVVFLGNSDWFDDFVRMKRKKIADFNYEFFMDLIANGDHFNVDYMKIKLDNFLLGEMDAIKSEQYKLGLKLQRRGYQMNIK